MATMSRGAEDPRQVRPGMRQASTRPSLTGSEGWRKTTGVGCFILSSPSARRRSTCPRTRRSRRRAGARTRSPGRLRPPAEVSPDQLDVLAVDPAELREALLQRRPGGRNVVGPDVHQSDALDRAPRLRLRCPNRCSRREPRPSTHRRRGNKHAARAPCQEALALTCPPLRGARSAAGSPPGDVHRMGSLRLARRLGPYGVNDERETVLACIRSGCGTTRGSVSNSRPRAVAAHLLRELDRC